LHELSIAFDICRITEEHVGPADLGRVVEVGVEVGNNAGIEIDSLEFCLEALLGSAPFGRAVPKIDRLEGDELRVTYVEVEDGSP
jgi:Zn finger protein HypA/HybF involved in hydrogenase expression